MTIPKRPLALAGAAPLLALALTACGGGAPTDASEEEFCEVVTNNDFFDDIDFADPDEEAILEAIQEQAERLEEVGTPEDIPDDAREGFEITLEAVDDLEAEDIDFDDEEFIEGDFSDDERDKVEAYTEYETETCRGELPTELPTGLPTDLPTDLTEIPTDLLTELPSGFPTDLTEIPTEFLTEIPTDLLTELPSDFPTEVPTS